MPAPASVHTMTAVSPKPSSPGTPILEWDEAQVNEYFVSLGLKQYESVIYGELCVTRCTSAVCDGVGLGAAVWKRLASGWSH